MLLNSIEKSPETGMIPAGCRSGVRTRPMTDLSYQSGFFPNRRGKRLFYVADGPTHAAMAWVFCSPLFEEKVFTQRVYRNFAGTLAGLGHRVLRFDYEGDGDSEGDTAETGTAELIEDIMAACQFVRDAGSIRSVGLFGLRFGGTLALLAATQTGAAQALAWCPITDGKTYFRDLLRFNLTTQLAAFHRIVTSPAQLRADLQAGRTVSILGTPIGQRLAATLQATTLPLANPAPACRTHLVSCASSRKSAASEGAEAIARAWGVAHRSVALEPFWHEPKQYDPHQAQLVKASLEMLTEENGPA